MFLLPIPNFTFCLNKSFVIEISAILKGSIDVSNISLFSSTEKPGTLPEYL